MTSQHTTPTQQAQHAAAAEQSARAASLSSDAASRVEQGTRGTVILLIVGVIVGMLAGLFGIGGGTVIVPALVWLGFTQRHAAATSMLAIIPTSISGVLSYALHGNVDWLAALLLFCGMVFGGQIGSWLLARLSELVLRWAFVVFLIFVVANQAIFIPSRDATIAMSPLTGALLVLLGLVTGILAGLLGIGGGAIYVPALSILFGASDLIARGTSLLAMFPNALTTTVANLKRGMVHVKAGLIIGITAALVAPFGTWVAGVISPRLGAALFTVYLAVLLIRSIWVALKATRAARTTSATHTSSADAPDANEEEAHA